jgi:rod shape-determining protein MreD
MIRKRTQALQVQGWLILPVLVCLVSTVVLATPIRVFGIGLPQPVFPMVLAFVWAVIRPSILGPFALLAVGFFLDLFWGAPLGLWALALLLAYAGAVVSRSLVTGRGAFMLAMWYLSLTVVAFTAAYLTIMLRAHITPSLTDTILQFLATAALFPVARRMIDHFENADFRPW